MMSTAAVPSARTSTEIVALQVLVAVFLAIRLWTQFNSGLVGDEAYYWMWGQHPAPSYFDHPPLHAWLLGLVSLVSWHPFAVRALTWGSLAIVAWVFWSWSRRLAPNEPQLWFWRAAAIYLASPLFFVLTGGAYNDHLLVALSLSAVHCFAVYVERVEADAPGSKRWLFAAAAVLGLAVLTKYNAVFVGIGFAATFLIRPKLRPLVLTPAPWLAAALAIGLQAPVFWWNFTEGGGSYRFHLADRWHIEPGLHWINLLRFAGLSILLWSPFLVWPLIRLIGAPKVTGFPAAVRSVALWTFAASTLVFSVTAIVLDAFFYWNIVALVSVTALLASFTNWWLRLLHYAFGLVVAIIALVHLTVIPTAFLLGTKDYGSAINYDWRVVAEHMRAQAAEHPDALLAATRYSTTAQLGAALGTTDVVQLSPDFSNWDIWQKDRDFTGHSALILVDEEDGHHRYEYLEAHFETLTELDRFDIVRLGQPIYPWRIMLGEGWKP